METFLGMSMHSSQVKFYEKAVKAYFTQEQYEKFGDMVTEKRAPKANFFAAFAGPFWFVFHRMYLEAFFVFALLQVVSVVLSRLVSQLAINPSAQSLISLLSYVLICAYLAEPLLKRHVHKKITEVQQRLENEEAVLTNLTHSKSDVDRKLINRISILLLIVLSGLLFYAYTVNPVAVSAVFKAQFSSF